MFIRDLEGNEYFLEGVVKHEDELNGDERIDMDIAYTDNNAEFLSKQQDLSMWIIIFEDKEYRIISSNQSGYGDKYKVTVTAILYIFDWLNTHRIEERIDASLTVKEAFDLVFNDSPFTYVIVNSAYSERFEGLGEGAVKLELFKTFIERYGYEFKIVNNVVYLHSQIGNDTNFEYRYKVNADDITKEVDASEMWTVVRGYADYREDGEPPTKDKKDDNSTEEVDPTKVAKLKPGKMENNPYVSPLAKIIGVREGPSVRNGNIKDPKLLLKQMKKVVDDSVKISFTANIFDMSQAGYDYQHAVKGDRVFLVDERIGLDTEIRVVKIDREVNHLGELLKIEITFGTSNLADTYSSNLATAVKDIQDLIEGRKSLPFPALDMVSRSMVKTLQNTTSELLFDQNGIHAIDKTNKNNQLTMNSSGLMISTDAGNTAKTAITAEGIVADAITTGSLNTQLVTILGREGYMYMDGDVFVATDPDSFSRTEISRKGLKVRRPDGAVWIENGMVKSSYELQMSMPQPLSDNTSIVGNWYSTNNTKASFVEEYFFNHQSRYLKLIGRGKMNHNTSTKYDGRVYVQSFGDNEIVASQVISKDYIASDTNSAGDLVEIVIDLGVPTYQDMHFYILIKSNNKDSDVLFKRSYLRLYG